MEYKGKNIGSLMHSPDYSILTKKKKPMAQSEKNHNDLMKIHHVTKRLMAEKMKKGNSYKKEIDNKKPLAKKDSQRFEENGGMSGNKK